MVLRINGEIRISSCYELLTLRVKDLLCRLADSEKKSAETFTIYRGQEGCWKVSHYTERDIEGSHTTSSKTYYEESDEYGGTFQDTVLDLHIKFQVNPV